MSMFCYQCQEACGNTGCTVKGICGKEEGLAKLQDLILYTVKGISLVVVEGKISVAEINDVNKKVTRAVFMTITNANFDDNTFVLEINNLLKIRDGGGRRLC